MILNNGRPAPGSDLLTLVITFQEQQYTDPGDKL